MVEGGYSPLPRPPSTFSAGEHCDTVAKMIFFMHSIPFYQDNIPNKWTRIQPGQDKCPSKSSGPIRGCFILCINGLGAIERVQKCQSSLQLLHQRRWREDGCCRCTADAAATPPYWAGDALRGWVTPSVVQRAVGFWCLKHSDSKLSLPSWPQSRSIKVGIKGEEGPHKTQL